MEIRLTSDADRHLVIDRSMLDDPRLSFRAKGLLSYLLAHPGIDASNKKLLSSASLEGMDAVKTALKELEEAGYFRQVQEVIEDGSVQEIGVISPVSRIPLLEPQPIQKPEVFPGEGSAAPSHKNLDTSAQRIIDQLNTLRRTAWDWARYTPISAKHAKNIEHINSRLADSYTEEDLILVLEYLAAVDGGREKSRKYFNCVTPFNTKNFERNLAMARDWDETGRSPSSKTPAQRIISRLNTLREDAWDWAIYTPLPSNSDASTADIVRQLNAGYSESDLILVLEYRASVDGGNEEARKYFDASTPFNEKNFERSLAMARDWDAKGRQTETSHANPGIRRGSEYYEKARKRSDA
jgi:hypothetical protein